MNKLDRDIRDPMELLDEVENELKIGCARSPAHWLRQAVPEAFTTSIKMKTYLYQTGKGHTIQKCASLKVK